MKFPLAIAIGVVLTGPVGALMELKITHTPFSVNKLRNEGRSIQDATFEASLLRLRPIMMTALVACLGLLPAVAREGDVLKV
jgi:cobalt-zinc-cadmium resistance protein CzcA